MSAVKPKAQIGILELEYENLASQFAEAVTMSPVDGRSSSMELEQLLNTLADPFTTKKQLPRTPESLIMDVRTSWRKAVEEGMAEKKNEKCHDLSWLRTPISEIKERSPSPETFFFRDSTVLNADPLPCSPLLSQQGTSQDSTVAWDASQLGNLRLSSSNIVHFSIAHEAFPDAEAVSFNCSDDPQDLQEGEELLLPPVTPCSPGVQTTCQIVRRHLDKSPSAGRFTEIKSDFMPSALISPGLDSGEKVFSLREEIPLPNLITFSPMDQL